MKNIIILILAAIIMVPAIDAQNKELEKQLKKEYKAKMKEYKKEKWKLFGSSRSLEVALLKHYDKLNTLGDNGKEVPGVATRFISKNVGYQTTITNACVSYAQQAGSHVRGRVLSDMAGDGADTSGEFDRFYGAYERAVEKEIKGELQSSYSIIRQIGTDERGRAIYEMQTFFIVDESAASRARVRAMENAFKESEAAQKYGQQISEFVQEAFRDQGAE